MTGRTTRAGESLCCMSATRAGLAGLATGCLVMLMGACGFGTSDESDTPRTWPLASCPGLDGDSWDGSDRDLSQKSMENDPQRIDLVVAEPDSADAFVVYFHQTITDHSEQTDAMCDIAEKFDVSPTRLRSGGITYNDVNE